MSLSSWCSLALLEWWVGPHLECNFIHPTGAHPPGVTRTLAFLCSACYLNHQNNWELVYFFENYLLQTKNLSVRKRMLTTKRPHQHEQSKDLGWHHSAYRKSKKEGCTCWLIALSLLTGIPTLP